MIHLTLKTHTNRVANVCAYFGRYHTGTGHWGDWRLWCVHDHCKCVSVCGKWKLLDFFESVCPHRESTFLQSGFVDYERKQTNQTTARLHFRVTPGASGVCVTEEMKVVCICKGTEFQYWTLRNCLHPQKSMYGTLKKVHMHLLKVFCTPSTFSCADWGFSCVSLRNHSKCFLYLQKMFIHS